MKVVIFGASGGTGRELVRQAVAAGHDVCAFVRRSSTVEAAGVQVCQGDIADAAAVNTALVGRDAAISAIGAPTPFRPYPAFLEGIRNILAGVEHAGASRLLYLSFVGVPESREQFGFVGQHVIAPGILRQATEGHRLNEELIKASSVNWTIVRAPKLTNGSRTSSYRVAEYLKPRGVVPTLSRADVAELMLQALTDPQYARRCVTVMH